jgi:hypothetical protein
VFDQADRGNRRTAHGHRRIEHQLEPFEERGACRSGEFREVRDELLFAGAFFDRVGIEQFFDFAAEELLFGEAVETQQLGGGESFIEPMRALVSKELMVLSPTPVRRATSFWL